MNTQSSAMPAAFGTHAVGPATISPWRRFYWSVRRELWENRWLYLAPLGIALVFLAGFFVSTVHLPARMRLLAMFDPAQQRAIMVQPYDIAAALMMAIAILMDVFYCADALHGERRDRSILFWKSMPVSDSTTVLSKAIIPIILVPLFTSAVAIALHCIMLVESSVVLAASGVSAAPLWTQLGLPQMWALVTYHIVTAHALWPAPIYCWLLLVSAWARRATLLWATLPVLVIGGLEALIFHTTHFVAMVGLRFIGASSTTAVMEDHGFPWNPMTHITIFRFLLTPGLWLGFLVAAGFLLAAIRLRRSNGVI